MRTAVQRMRWVRQGNCFPFPSSLEQTLQKLLPRATYPTFTFCSPLHSYLSVINGNWKQLCLFFFFGNAPKHQGAARAVVPWETGSLGDPCGMSRAGSSQHPSLGAGQCLWWPQSPGTQQLLLAQKWPCTGCVPIPDFTPVFQGVLLMHGAVWWFIFRFLQWRQWDAVAAGVQLH